MKVQCNKCGVIADDSEFPKGRDFFQNRYIARCVNSDCDNRQTPGGASMRMMPGHEPPFSYVREEAPSDPFERVFYQADEAS